MVSFFTQVLAHTEQWTFIVELLSLLLPSLYYAHIITTLSLVKHQKNANAVSICKDFCINTWNHILWRLLVLRDVSVAENAE